MKYWSIFIGIITGIITLPIISIIIIFITWMRYPTWSITIPDCQLAFNNCGNPITDLNELKTMIPIPSDDLANFNALAQHNDLNQKIILATNTVRNQPMTLANLSQTANILKRTQTALNLSSNPTGLLSKFPYRRIAIGPNTYKYPTKLNLASITLNFIVSGISRNSNEFYSNSKKLNLLINQSK